MKRNLLSLIALLALLLQALAAEAARLPKEQRPRLTGKAAAEVLAKRNATAARKAKATKPRGKSLRPAVAATAAVAAATAGAETASKATRQPPRDGEAEARLIGIYRLIGQARGREALAQAELLVKDHPNFQLAQLVYGDLLRSQTGALRTLGDVPDTTAIAAASTLTDLREESRVRLRALRERPPAGTVPAQFLQLPERTRHAIAVDASRSRLYLFENGTGGLRLLADYYISVGKLGVDKTLEGDQRTPLGVYFITSNLDPRTLKDFYGSGALPINYPNPLDVSRGKTGSGIWLHGTPPSQFARAPKASDGCVVLANPDLERIIRTVEVRTTPVVIAQHLRWVAPHGIRVEGQAFAEQLNAWRAAKSSGDVNRLLTFYRADFRNNGKGLDAWLPVLREETGRASGREIQIKDLSLLHWTDTMETMVVTFGEVIAGQRSGPVRRQYWSRQGPHWKIFYEGIIG